MGEISLNKNSAKGERDMHEGKGQRVQTSIGEGHLDSTGAALAVCRLEAERSYKGTDLLLQAYLRDSDEKAWETIKAKIDYTYRGIDDLLTILEKETGFLARIQKRIEAGQKLLFKPNLVSVENIDPYTCGPMAGSSGNTEWSFVAAVMRWFHDRGGISFYRMCLGEAATALSSVAALYRQIKTTGRPVTTEAVIEGLSDDFYGGWGFYFVRKYLAESAESSLGEDPFQGLEESMAGTFLPPGAVRDKLLVYDLNRICDDPSKGREITVPAGENFQALLLHKVIVGGHPDDAGDRALYPGSILINLPRLKVHAQALFTNAIKNIGIGLYPMEVSRSQSCAWEYATPRRAIPGMKGAIPHQVWVPEMDPTTCLPKKDPEGRYVVTKTGGLTGTMLDIIAAVAAQDVYMMHIVDAVEAINRDHQGIGLGIKEAEGLLVAGLDPVATDLFCARYMFSNLGLKEAEGAGLEDGFGGRFPQAVSVPFYDGKVIQNAGGYDSPLSRDACFERAEKRGLGKTAYYVQGRDESTGLPLASFRGRLGGVSGDAFTEIFTRVLYSDIYKMPWDLQKTFLAYLAAVDRLEGTSRKQNFIEAFDETGDGTVSYEEYGKKGIYGPTMILGGLHMSTRGEADESESFRAFYALMSTPLRCSNPRWNPEGHDFAREQVYGSVAVVAQLMSQAPRAQEDPFFPGVRWGQGQWPSYTLAFDRYIKQILYGWRYPARLGISSLFGSACAFADSRQNNRTFVGRQRGVSDPEAAQKYVVAVREDRLAPLDFTFFVPSGYGDQDLPNVRESDDPQQVFTVVFEGGKIKWPDMRTDDLEIKS
jgi:hypothetical protein